MGNEGSAQIHPIMLKKKAIISQTQKKPATPKEVSDAAAAVSLQSSIQEAGKFVLGVGNGGEGAELERGNRSPAPPGCGGSHSSLPTGTWVSGCRVQHGEHHHTRAPTCLTEGRPSPGVGGELAVPHGWWGLSLRGGLELLGMS